MSDFSTRARETAEREAEAYWDENVLGHRILRKSRSDGFTAAASRLPSEEEIADCIDGSDIAWYELWCDSCAGLGDDPGPRADFTARAVRELIEKKMLQ